MAEEKKRNCPLCETDIEKSLSECPTCGITRRLIELDAVIGPVDLNVVSEEIDELGIDIFSMEEEDLFSLTRRFGFGDTTDTNESVVPDEAATQQEKSDEVKVHEEMVFECPLCGTEVGESEVKCPGCDAIFEVEEEISEDVSDIESESIKGDDDEETASLKKEYESMLNDAKAELRKIHDIPVSPAIARDLLKQSVILGKEGKYNKGLERSSEVISVCKEMVAFVENIDKAKGLINDIRKIGGEYQSHLKRLVVAKKMLERGDIEESIKETEKIIQDMEELFEFERSFLDIKKEIKRLGKSSINLPFRDQLKDILAAKNDGEYQKAIEIQDDIKKIVHKIDESLNLINTTKMEINKLRKKDLEYKGDLEDLVRAKKKLEKGSIDEAREELESLLAAVKSKL